MDILLACILCIAPGIVVGEVTFHQHGEVASMRYVHIEDAVPVSQESCGVRVLHDELYMPGASLAQKQKHFRDIFHVVNKTFASSLMQVYVIDAPAPVHLGYTSDDAIDVLVHMRNYTDFHKACAIIWFSGREFSDGTIGLAYVKGACEYCNILSGGAISHIGMVAIAKTVHPQDTWIHTLNDEAWVAAHELAHLMGARHTEQSNVVMNAMLQKRRPATFEAFDWSNQSIQAIKSFMFTECNDDTCFTTPPVVHAEVPSQKISMKKYTGLSDLDILILSSIPLMFVFITYMQYTGK